MDVEYLGANYGTEAVSEYLAQYSSAVYCKVIDKIKAEGLPVMITDA